MTAAIVGVIAVGGLVLLALMPVMAFVEKVCLRNYQSPAFRRVSSTHRG